MRLDPQHLPWIVGKKLSNPCKHPVAIRERNLCRTLIEAQGLVCQGYVDEAVGIYYTKPGDAAHLFKRLTSQALDITAFPLQGRTFLFDLIKLFT